MDITTVARVKETSASSWADTDEDVVLAQLVSAVSTQFEKYLRRHVEVTARTEVYRLRKWQGLVRVKGWPITSVSSVKYHDTQDFSSVTALTANSDYVVDTSAGTFDLLFGASNSPGFLQVISTGGMATNQTTFAATYPDIVHAADLQILEQWRRRNTPGGNVTNGPSGTAFDGQLKLLDFVTDVLDQYRAEVW